MRVLVACEESQTVTIELRKLGHEAYSCDIMACSGGHEEWHIKNNALYVIKPSSCGYDYGYRPYINFVTSDGEYHVLGKRWDMIIAHPPCTYLSNAGARFLYPNGKLDKGRLAKGLEGKELFMKIYNADCPRIAIENPTPSKIYGLPQHTQTIQPWMFGHPYKKRTNLWLKGLPELIPTDIIEVSESTKVAGNWFNKGGKDRQKNRSKTFPGIAKAMATQWSCRYNYPIQQNFLDEVTK